MPLNTDPARFRPEGYCLLRGLCDPTLLKGIEEDILEAIAKRKADPAFAAAVARYHRDWAPDLHLAYPRVAAFLRGAPFPDLVRKVYPRDADFRFCTTMTKTAEKAAHVDWHQDAGYAKDLEWEMFSFWIAVTDSRRDNGCLRVIPGSHAQGLVSHIPSPTLAHDKVIETVDESRALDVEMEAGDILMLNRFVFHASWPNETGRLRIGLIAGFQPPKPEGQHLEFERQASFRYLRGGQPCWSRLIDPA